MTATPKDDQKGQDREIGQKILIDNVKSFDLCSLLKALYCLGYAWKDFFFEGIQSYASTPAICEKIMFSDVEYPQVTLTLNLGLLSTNSPIPHFLFKEMDRDSVGAEKFTRFLNYFNHHLIKELLYMSFIEENPFLFPDWTETHRDYFSLLGLNTVSAIYLLMQVVFPEFKVETTKNPKRHKIKESAFTLGKGGLGQEAIIGGNATKTFSSFRVILETEENLSEDYQKWHLVILKRLKSVIFPLLRQVDIHLSIILVIKNKIGSLLLGSSSHLGFERIGEKQEPFALMIFHGHVR